LPGGPRSASPHPLNRLNLFRRILLKQAAIDQDNRQNTFFRLTIYRDMNFYEFYIFKHCAPVLISYSLSNHFKVPDWPQKWVLVLNRLPQK
jgi:hypothetical protein